MAINILKFRLREQNRGEGGDEEGARPSPAEINDRANRSRLERIEQIGRVADGRRANELNDVDGERVTGRFQGGEFDDSDEAREREAAEAEEAAAEAIREEEERARADEEERGEARRLQSEGAEGGDPRESADADEKVVDGVRYYRTMVSGNERWLTLRQLREGVSAAGNTEEALQRAEEAIRSAAQAELTPKEVPAEVDEKDLENIILSAGMGDEEAVRKLVQVIRARPAGVDPQAVQRQVSQQIATQREVDRAEGTQADLLGNEILAPIFRSRLREYAQSKPKTRIVDAYKEVGDAMRKDFAAMIPKAGSSQQPLSKTDRKRQIVTPPSGAGRQPPREDDDREVPVSETIDAIARSRGFDRAHRIRRS
jgi:hypothetical protein